MPGAKTLPTIVSSSRTKEKQASGAIVAPFWHTALLVVVMLSVATLGAILSLRHAEVTAPVDAHTRIAAAYVPTILVEWLVFFYACRVARPPGTWLALVGRRWDSRRRVGVDLALALAIFFFVAGGEFAYARITGAVRNPAVTAMLPHTTLERLVWMGVALSAGFCEEVVYRGYLQRQLGAFTGAVVVGVVLQAVLFGVAHAEQGTATLVRFAVYGLAFGIVALRRESLIPGIVAHVAIDLVGGLGGG